jgi:hypothetical protein
LLILAVLSLRQITAPFLPYKPAEIMLWLVAPVHKEKFVSHYNSNVRRLEKFCMPYNNTVSETKL